MAGLKVSRGAPPTPVPSVEVLDKSDSRGRKPQKKSQDRIDLIEADLNKAMKGVGRIDRGKNITFLDPERIRTGILGLDVVSNGGIPRGSKVQFWGPWSSSKTSTLLQIMAEEQAKGNHTAFAAGEGFNKDWARVKGLWIPYSEKEYEAINLAHHGKPELKTLTKAMEEYDRWGLDKAIGSVSVMQSPNGDTLLEMTARAVKANAYSVIGVDSIAVLKNTRQLEEMEVGDEEQYGGGQNQMLNRFSHRIDSALNTRYTVEGKPDIDGVFPNATALICLNQARIKNTGQKRGGQIQYQPVMGEGLKHFWSLSVRFLRGEEIGAMGGLDGSQTWKHWAVEIQCKGHKSKIGPEGREAWWHLYIEKHGDNAKGSVDGPMQTRMWGVDFGVIEQEGAYYNYNGERIAHGKDNCTAFLRERPELCKEIDDEVVRRCRLGA